MATVADAFDIQTAGMQSHLDSAIIPKQAFAKGINVSVRGGLAKTRGGFSQEAVLGAGVFQGAGVWSLNDADRLVYILDGYLHVYNIDTGLEEADSEFNPLFVPVPVTPPYLHSSGQRMSTATTRYFFTQVDRYMVVQDGVNTPIVLEISGVVGYVAYVTHNYVAGFVGAYAHGRYHYSPILLPLLAPAVTADPASYDLTPTLATVTGRPYFVSSDVLDTLNPEYVRRMAEHRVAATGGALALPQELGFITAMSTIRGASTGTGVGELLVFARNGVSAFDVSISRSQWHTSAISKVLFAGAGTNSPFSPRPVNDDVAYLDRLGQLRLLRYDKTRLAGSGGSLSNTPMSSELKYFHDLEDVTKLPYAYLTSADNRITWTMVGETGPSFKALASLDLALSFAMSGTLTPPAYDGVWTGFHFYHVFSVNDILYTIVSREGSVLLLSHDDTTTYDLTTTPVQATLVTRQMNFEDPVNLKTLMFAELWIGDIQTDTTIEVFYRPQGYTVWTSMGSKSINVPAGGAPQFRRKLKFGVDTATAVCNPIDDKVLWDSAEFQFAIRWTGYCTIDGFRAVAEAHPEMDPDVCATDNPDNDVVPLSEGLEDFDYWV